MTKEKRDLIKKIIALDKNKKYQFTFIKLDNLGIENLTRLYQELSSL